ncbi:PREDICTED: glutamate receptor 4-like [Priapulus caudatus]|uniref:Glutamate receptor 4-like n=1 Tax=Priapulus caudatus TaxID=37621 RepID=A0ABM1DXB1_PRICU|nr:PREDICTED: glutamate receptor 4-like [Priapulus caudatus]
MRIFFEQDKWKYLDRTFWIGAGNTRISYASALMYDTVKVIIEAYTEMIRQKPERFQKNFRRNEMYNQDSKGIYCRRSEVIPWERGEKILRFLKNVTIPNGLTGPIQFDSKGRRTNYHLDVWEFTLKDNMDLRDPPYLTVDEEKLTASGNERYTGFCMDLVKRVASKINFKFKVEVVKDGTYGKASGDGTWSGMIGELIRDEADLAVAPLTITSARERVIDFSKPFMNLGISIMIKKPEKQKPGVFSFMNPLSYKIWMCIIFALIGVSIVLFLVSRFNPYEWRVEYVGNQPVAVNDFNISNSLWFSLGAFMQQGCDISPRLTSKLGVYQTMWQYMETQKPSVFVFKNSEGVKRVRQSKGKYAFLLESTTNDYINNRKPCDTMKVGENLDSKGYGIATPLRSDLREQITWAVLKLREDGELQTMENTWWYDKGECGGADTKDASQSELTLSNVAGIFYILIGGLVLSMITAVLEFFYRSRVEARQNKQSLTSAMRQKMRMSIEGNPEGENGRISTTVSDAPNYFGSPSQMVSADGMPDTMPYHGYTHTQV